MMYGIAALCLSYVFSQFFRSFLAVLTPVLSNDLGMTATGFAYASGAWFIAFALFQFPVGILLDSLGPKRTAGFIFTVFTGLGAFVFAIAPNPTMIVVAMALIGVGCSASLMAPMYIIVREYDARKFATFISIFISIGSLGNITSSEPLAAAVEAFGWRQTSAALGAMVLLTGSLIWMTVKDPDKPEQGSQGGSFRDLLLIRQLWPIFPIILCGYVVVAGLRGSWIGPFHVDLYQYDVLEIGRATLFMSIALVLGTLFFGPLDRIFNSRKKVVVMGNLVVLSVCLLMCFYVPQSPWLGTLAFVAAGFFGASYAVQMAHGKSFVPPHLTGRGVTLLNFCSIGGAGIFQWISGPVVETFSTSGLPQDSYQALFGYYAVLIAITLVIYAFSTDAKPDQQESGFKIQAS